LDINLRRDFTQLDSISFLTFKRMTITKLLLLPFLVATINCAQAEIVLNGFTPTVDDTVEIMKQNEFRFQSDSSHFVVEFPGEPEVDVFDSKQGVTTIYMYIDPVGTRYLVDYRERTKDDSWESTFLFEKFGLEYSMLATVSKPIKSKKKGAKTTRFDALTSMENMNFLLVLTKTSVYRIIVTRDLSIESNDVGEKFLESFEIIR
jgi:hypothetical protein